MKKTKKTENIVHKEVLPSSSQDLVNTLRSLTHIWATKNKSISYKDILASRSLGDSNKRNYLTF